MALCVSIIQTIIATLLFLITCESNEYNSNQVDECQLRGFVFPVEAVTTGNNPYGMVVIPENHGQFEYGDLLISNWNDPTNQFFGQGNLIKQIRNHQLIRTITIDKNSQSIGECAHDNVVGTGLGFTMAMAYLGKGKIIQCSIPINFVEDEANDDGETFPPFPGCCLIINDAGKILATFRGNGINGPWGGTSYIYEDKYSKTYTVTLFLSNVLGPIGSPLTNNNGNVVRYIFELPNNDNDWQSGYDDNNVGTLGKHTLMISNLISFPINISIGSVGPSGLAFLSSNNNLIIADTLGGGKTSSESGDGRLLKIKNALQCTSQTCSSSTFSSCSEDECYNPIGINWSQNAHKSFDLLVANGGDGNLIQYNANGAEICFFIGDADGGGTLFNIVSIPTSNDNDKRQVAYVDDAQNDVMFLSSYST